MDKHTLEQRIEARGREFFGSIAGEAPSIFNKGWWTGKVMDWSMRNEDFKVKLFRFVDVMPAITDNDSLKRHIEEYFAGESGDLPPVMKLGLKGAGVAGKLGGALMAKTIRSNIEKMGRQFIVGQTPDEAVKTVSGLRRDGFAFTLDILGEATVSRTEAEARRDDHLDLLDALDEAQKKFKALGGAGNGMDWGHAPMVNLSVKPSSLYSQTKARDFEGSVAAIVERLLPIYQKAVKMGAGLCIDMESLDYKDITIEVFKRLRSHPDTRRWPHLTVVLQTYLKCTEDDLRGLLDWSRAQDLPISVRLVKGAYWDFETIRARQNGWEIPVYTIKAESDAAFERCAALALEHHDACHLCCASHNVRTISAVMETALALQVPEERYEFQVLFGMAEPVRKGLKAVAGRVRLYCPYGELIPGMAYLVRRLLENTANESFLRQSFVGEADIKRLLADPTLTAETARAETTGRPAPAAADRFANAPAVDFTIAAERTAFPEAIAAVRGRLGRTVPLFIGGREVTTDDVMDSYNPAETSEMVARICQAGVDEVQRAIDAARAAQPAWAALPMAERAAMLRRAARAARERMHELCAWQVLEVGKQWDQAHGDVGEAIDFLEYYAREAERLGQPRRMGHAPGEINHYRYQAKGVAAVIAPWNFPLAISTGMTSAAMVTGNCVLYKPSGLSSAVGWNLCELLRQAGVPDGVFNYLPGRSSVMGDFLVGHKDVHLIAFTGSMETGLHIIQTAARPATGQRHVKKVIAEMGGKNAIIIDDDAELDEAVAGVLYSAFGFQGQKCSACSRVIVLDGVYDTFVHRLVEGARSLKLGPAEDPANNMGPVVDTAAQAKIMDYVALAEKEGRVLLRHEADPELVAKGCWTPLTIVEGITPEHRLAREEVFGPVLAVMRARDFDQAIEWANDTSFALTGGIFSRSPQRLERARQEFNVGNLYLNRGCTGSLVERQPFGGHKLSGIGSKAGGPDYLLQFMDPTTVTENTMRRGFAPIAEDDDWV